MEMIAKALKYKLNILIDLTWDIVTKQNQS